MQQNIKAMIIEDDFMLAEFYMTFIKREFNIDSVICRNGVEVRNYIKNNGIDNLLFILCDLNIPISEFEEGSGPIIFEGFELIEDLLPACKVIIASGYISPEIAREARRLGVVSLFQKPPNLNTLAIVINFLLNCV